MDGIIFSAMNMVVPATGALLGLGFSFPIMVLYVVMRKSLGFGMITMGIPTLCAMANWSLVKKYSSTLGFLLQVCIPATCMGLFIFHPIAGQAWPYALYWVIPVASFCMRRFDSVFLTALSSTFIAHAVGSILWLYAVSMTVNQWMALIPIVAAERLLFATGSIIFYRVMFRVTSTTTGIRYKTR